MVVNIKLHHARCPQASTQTITGTAKPVQNEDCLTLNIYAPENITTKLPVMVFVHGGGNTAGSGAGSKYNGTNMINANTENPVIIVTINYRCKYLSSVLNVATLAWSPVRRFTLCVIKVGALGWLAGNVMEAEGALNLGLLDQAYTFAWVRYVLSCYSIRLVMPTG